ncbi:MAG: hypothetical protein ACRDNW_12600, partial [Trebonia sp.]
RSLGRAVPPAGDAGRLAQVRRQLSDEVAMLRAERHAPGAERARHLADLATRIDALLAWLASDAALSGRLAADLASLAAELRDCDQPGRLRGTELDTLWEKAIRQLAAFAAPPAPGTGPGQPGRPARH